MRKIAVYGTLRRGFGNYGWLLSDQKFLGEQTIELPYKMVSLGGFPGLVPADETHGIFIEVFEIDGEAERSVDSLEGYPHFYDRVEIETEFGTAWIYILANSADTTLPDVHSGDWKQYVENRRNVANELLS